MKRKIVAVLTACISLFICLFGMAMPVGAVPTGTTFTAETIYAINKAFTSDIKTIEAVLSLPAGYSDRGGTILGNFVSTTATCFLFEINTDGHPRIYTVSSGRQTSHVFDQVNVATGEKVHVAVAIDNAAGKMHCYVDGVLKQTLTPTYMASSCVSDTAMYLGGDLRSGNEQYFKGTLYSVTAFKDVRTADEIASDANSLNTSDSNLLAAYELSGHPAIIDDKGPNDYDAVFQSNWFADKDPVAGYEYSFVAIGDTQHVSQYHPEHMATIYDWVVGNIDSKNIKFVMGLGDITDWYQVDPTDEWVNVSAAIKKMDGKVPYSLCRGNHDGLTFFNQYFPYSDYKNTVGGTYDNTSIVNSWRKFEVNGIKYMLFTLNYSPDDNVLAWASDLIAQNPNYNVIITTHMYLNKDGTTLDASEQYAPTTSSGATYGPNDGNHIWDKLISKHENIVLVLSGHVPSDRVVLTQTEGKNGTVVSQMLIDPSAGDTADNANGMVTLLHFSNNGSRVTVENYSTVKDQYYMTENQFSFDIEVIREYTLNFVDNTGKSYSMPDSITAVEGSTVTLPDVSATANGKLGYWSLREDGKYRRYNPGESYTVKSDTTFYFVTPTVDLTINAQTQGNVAQNFIYQITATDFSMEVCATAGTPLTVCDLPADKAYTVTEMTGYSWRYTTATAAAGGATGTTSIVVDVANASGGVIDVTFSHSNRNDKWLTDTKSETTQYVPYRMVKCEITDFGEHARNNGTTPVRENLEVYNPLGHPDYIYVRMVITPYYVDGEGNIANRAPWTLPEEINAGWVKHNGFYYYTKPLAPNSAESVAARTYTTGRLFATDFTFGENQAWSYSAQAIEATADAAKELWGVVISEGSVTAAP